MPRGPAEERPGWVCPSAWPGNSRATKLVWSLRGITSSVPAISETALSDSIPTRPPRFDRSAFRRNPLQPFGTAQLAIRGVILAVVCRDGSAEQSDLTHRCGTFSSDSGVPKVTLGDR